MERKNGKERKESVQTLVVVRVRVRVRVDEKEARRLTCPIIAFPTLPLAIPILAD